MEKHQKESRHSGTCDGKWEKVRKEGGLYYTDDQQYVCFTCSATCVKISFPYK